MWIKYKLNLASINEENSNLKLELTSTNNETKFNVINLSPNNNKTSFTQKYYNKEKCGKDIFIVKPERITDDLYLSVDSPIKDYDTEYTFKYSLLNNYKDKLILSEYPYDYQPNITKCNISNTSDSYIKFDKIKTKKDPNNKKTTNCNCNYYISIYKKDKNGKNDSLSSNNTISIKKNDAPFATYKVSNDSNDSFIETNMHVYTDDEFYYEVIGEDKDTKELFGYNKRYPGEFPDDNEKEEDQKKDDGNDDKKRKKKGKGFDWLLFILILLGIILIIITICLCCKYCCNSKEKKSKLKKKDTINLNLEQNESLYENPLLEDQIKIKS